jgi:hypothetical protein
MTIAITFFSKNEILLVSDQFRYLLKENVVKDTLTHKLEVTHKNFEECVQSIYHDAPKIFRFGKNTGIIAVGDSRFSSILTTLNKRGNIRKQVLEELKKRKQEGFWCCRIGKYNMKKEQAEMVTITYENGKVNIIEHDQDNIGFDSFSPEMKDVFFKKYATIFYIGNTEEKSMVVKEFFDEISKLYNNNAGGQAVIAKIDKDGFAWIIKPKQSNFANFTTYAYNWCPEKIETQSTTEVAWSQQAYTIVLELTFECESTMLLLILAHAQGRLYSTDAGHKGFSFRLTLDDTELPDTVMRFIGYHSAGNYRQDNYSVHNVAIKTKGSHSLKLQMYTESSNCILYTYGRRLSILKGFYQGGTT